MAIEIAPLDLLKYNFLTKAIADQGFQNDERLARGDWGVWFGANLFKKPGREPGHVRHGPNP